MTAADSGPAPDQQARQPRLRLGVVGTGTMGRHHVRILAALPEAELVGIYDQRPEQAAKLAVEHRTRSFGSLEELTGQVEAVVLAVPTYAHSQIGCELLRAGIHLLVEKPMASTLEEADRLMAASVVGGGRDRVLAVGHVEFFNPAVQTLLRLGEAPRYIEIQRLSPFTPRSLDVDVILDLMIHDLQLLHALDASPIKEVRATGIDVLTQRIDIASVRLELASGVVATINTSRVSAEAVRKLRVYLASRYFSVDYRKQEIKGFGLRTEGEHRLIMPETLEVHRCEPLRAELEAFIAACQGREVSYVAGADGRRALETALTIRSAISRV
ncbi:MAG: Gfo/Idh/MocA family oxidoreductase [bacterium]|nr:Gfo/Idh/MocA family oxidoreductase [bacterium]